MDEVIIKAINEIAKANNEYKMSFSVHKEDVKGYKITSNKEVININIQLVKEK